MCLIESKLDWIECANRMQQFPFTNVKVQPSKLESHKSTFQAFQNFQLTFIASRFCIKLLLRPTTGDTQGKESNKAADWLCCHVRKQSQGTFSVCVVFPKKVEQAQNNWKESECKKKLLWLRRFLPERQGIQIHSIFRQLETYCSTEMMINDETESWQ